MGQSMTLRRTLMPNGIEMHSLWFSQRFTNQDSLKFSWQISLGDIYHGNEYDYEPQFINENDVAF